MGLLKQVFLFLADELAKASGFFSRLGLLKQVMFILLMSRDGGCGVKKEKSTAGVSVLFEGFCVCVDQEAGVRLKSTTRFSPALAWKVTGSGS